MVSPTPLQAVWVGGAGDVGGAGGYMQQPINPDIQNVFTAGERRSMCGDFIFIFHVLKLLINYGTQLGSRSQQQPDDLFGPNQLLGGYFEESIIGCVADNSHYLQLMC